MFKLHTRKQFDTARPLILLFSDAAGPIDLTDATAVTFTMRALDGTPKIAAGAMVKLNQTTNKGQAKYVWQTADVDTAANFRCEAKAVFTDGTASRFPSDEYAEITFLKALAP